MHYENKFNEYKGNLKLTWKLINEIINKKKSKAEIPDSFKENEEIISQPKEIANKFNEYFVNVGPNLADKIPEQMINYNTYLTKRYKNSLFLDAITEQEVETEINQLKVNKACGYDEISPKVVIGIWYF